MVSCSDSVLHPVQSFSAAAVHHAHASLAVIVIGIVIRMILAVVGPILVISFINIVSCAQPSMAER